MPRSIRASLPPPSPTSPKHFSWSTARWWLVNIWINPPPYSNSVKKSSFPLVSAPPTLPRASPPVIIKGRFPESNQPTAICIFEILISRRQRGEVRGRRGMKGKRSAKRRWSVKERGKWREDEMRAEKRGGKEMRKTKAWFREQGDRRRRDIQREKREGEGQGKEELMRVGEMEKENEQNQMKWRKRRKEKMRRERRMKIRRSKRRKKWEDRKRSRSRSHDVVKLLLIQLQTASLCARVDKANRTTSSANK